jgi:hypothetical protein
VPWAQAAADVCPAAARREGHVLSHGGQICYGWQIWEWPDVMIGAEFHAVWKDPGGKLHDLTPKPVPTDRVFLPDPVKVYEDRQVNNNRRALSDRPAVREFMEAADAEYEFLNRGARAAQHDLMLGASHSRTSERSLGSWRGKRPLMAVSLGRPSPPMAFPGRSGMSHVLAAAARGSRSATAESSQTLHPREAGPRFLARSFRILFACSQPCGYEQRRAARYVISALDDFSSFILAWDPKAEQTAEALRTAMQQAVEWARVG